MNGHPPGEQLGFYLLTGSFGRPLNFAFVYLVASFSQGKQGCRRLGCLTKAGRDEKDEQAYTANDIFHRQSLMSLHPTRIT